MSIASHPSADLAAFAAGLRFDDIPAPVLARGEDLFLDTLGSILAGSSARAVQSIERYAHAMGPTFGSFAPGPNATSAAYVLPTGASENLVARRLTTPLFAALVNAAAAHMVEQDDVHNGSVFHPAAVVFPPALAVAQAIGASGRELLTAVVAGYEVGIRVGEFLGRSHYRVFHTTGTAGTLAAAAAVGRLLKLDAGQMLHALGSAGTQAAGLWEFLRDAADSKQLHTAKAAADGLSAAWLAREGLTGARRILEGAQGMAAGMSRDADPARLTDRLGSRWALLETSFKYHASCRHTHPAADALLALMQTHSLQAADIARVTAQVHQGALDVLGPVVKPSSVHQSKFSMGTVLALIALRGRASLADFDAVMAADGAETHADFARAAAVFRDKVHMVLDAEVDAAYPARWIGKVRVTTTDGRTLAARVDEPKGDPGNTLSRAELEAKAMQLGTYQHAAQPAEVRALIDLAWGLREAAPLGRLLPTSR